MSAAPGTSRAERQAARDAANAAAYVSFTQAANQPGGGVNQPKYQTRGGPTWDPRWQSEFLKSNPNAVFDPRGNLIYNDADLGAAEVEAARAAQGLPPSYQTKGEPSGQYLAAVSAAGGDISKIKTKQKELEAARGEYTEAQRVNTEREKAAYAERERLNKLIEGRNIDETWAGNQLDNLNLEIQGYQRARAEYGTSIKNIDKARQDLAKEQRMAQSYQAKAAIASTKQKVTEGPRPIQNALAADYTQRLEASRPKPQRQRAQAQTGITTKLYANPDFMINAEHYTRPPSFQGDTRKERPKAQQGITDKLFLNPKYVTKEQQRESDKAKTITDWTLSLTENITTSKTNQPKNFAVSLVEGIPNKPKKLTQAQVDKMSPLEFATYKAEIDTYNQYVAKTNAQVRKTNIATKEEYKKDILQYIAEAKAAGSSLISIKSKTENKTVPIDKAFLEIMKTKDVTGFAPVPILPKNTAIVGTIQNQFLLSTEQRKQVEQKPIPGDFLGETLAGLEQMKKSPNEVVKAGANFYLATIGNLAGLSNVAGQYITKPLYEATSGKPTLTTLSYVPQVTSLPDLAVQKVASGGFEAIVKKDPKILSKALAELQNETGTYVNQTGIVGTVAGTAGFLFPMNPQSVISGAARIAPIRGGGFIVSTEEGAKVAYRALSLGYDTKSKMILGKYGDLGEGAGKFFKGDVNPALVGIEKFKAPTGSAFAVWEMAGYTPYQRTALAKPVIQYAEQKGLAPKGLYNLQELEARSMRLQQNLDWPYEKTISPNLLYTVSENIKSNAVMAELGYLAKKGKTDYIKGSVTTAARKDAMIRPFGDVDIETDQAKKAINYILSKQERLVKEGYTLGVEGSNITVGAIDLTKPIYSIKLKKGEVLHGTSKKGAENILEEGFSKDYSKRKDAVFVTPTPKLAQRFATRAAKQGRTEPATILSKLETKSILDFKKLSKTEQETLASENWLEFQENLIQYAKEKGYKGVTKPYKSTDPNAKIYEVLVYDESALSPEMTIKPFRYGIKEGTAKKIINFVTKDEEAKNLEGLDSAKVFGGDWPNDKLKLGIQGEKEKARMFGAGQQITAKTKSIANILTRESLEEAANLTPEQRAAILPEGMIFTKGAKGHRYTKDVMDTIMQTRDAARLAFREGDKKSALFFGKVMAEQFGFYKLDYVKEFKSYYPSTNRMIPPRPKAASSPASVAYGSVSTGISTTQTSVSSSILPEESPSIRDSVKSSVKSLRQSARSGSASSSAVFSAFSSKSAASPKSASSPASAFSRSVWSKSPGSVSSASAKSPFTKSPFAPSPASPKSPTVPSPRSMLSPSPSSPSSPLNPSPLSPNPISPLSPKPIIPLELSPILPKRAKLPKLDLKFKREEKTRKSKPPLPTDFLGNVSQENISSNYSRQEIILGIKRTAKKERKDLSFGKKQRSQMMKMFRF